MKKSLKVILIILFMFGVGLIYLGYCYGFEIYYMGDNDKGTNYIVLDNLVGMDIDEVINYAESNDIKINVSYEYSLEFLENKVISQDKDAGSEIAIGSEIGVVISKGAIVVEVYEEMMVNELGSVPIMMYHGIVDVSSNETGYIGGNVDKDGYNRTVEAFREDLEFYYQEGYRMIRLEDYVDGKIDVEMGKSPIILTFDDGNENNFRVFGEENGELIIDPNCAIGILEEFKKKYPDYGVTATFFVNSGLFMQDQYNEKILKWLVEHGYDVGNHTMTHCDFRDISVNEVEQEVGGLYQMLDDIISLDYVSIVALPFGSPYSREHSNYDTILSGTYLGNDYETKAALRVGWEAEVSCFDEDFNPTYLKRIRAYDNNGVDFDIQMNFSLLEDKKYISDGNIETIVVPVESEEFVGDRFDNLRLVTY